MFLVITSNINSLKCPCYVIFKGPILCSSIYHCTLTLICASILSGNFLFLDRKLEERSCHLKSCSRRSRSACRCPAPRSAGGCGCNEPESVWEGRRAPRPSGSGSPRRSEEGRKSADSIDDAVYHNYSNNRCCL